MEVKQLSSSLKNTCEIIYKIMLFLAVFDGIRSRTPIADYVTVFKEVSTFSLLTIILLTYVRSINKNILYYSNIFFIIYLVVLGTFVILFNDVSRSLLPMFTRKELPTPFAMHFKNIESFVVVFVLIHYEQITGRKINSILKYFVNLCVGYVLFTLLIYFKFPNSTFFQTPWYGRISIGYPTSDGQILSFALAYLVFSNLVINGVLKIIFLIILIIGIVMNATATGLLSIGLILFVYTLYYFISGKVIFVFSIKSLFYMVTIISIIFITKLVVEGLNDKMGNYPTLLDSKIGFITNKISSSLWETNSISSDIDIDFSEKLRSNQIEQAFYFNKDLASLALGGPISLGTLIENENYFLIRSYGYLGFILYYSWLALLFYVAFRKIKYEYARVLLVAIGILVITNSAIATTYLYGVAVSFGLFVAYYYNRSNDDNDYKVQLNESIV